jgi:hypothetical protein
VSRILVVGMGVPAVVASRRHAGPGLRSAHFASALAGAGHDVLLVCVLDEDQAPPPCSGNRPGLTIEFTHEKELLDAALRRRIDAFAPDGVVGVTVYAAALACRLRLDAPLWADVFGDIMAEAQAKAARAGSDWSIVHFWTLFEAVLERADRFSAVCAPQAHALTGQLGLAGRLSARTAGEQLVATIPCCVDPVQVTEDRSTARARLGFDDGDFVLLLSGGVNTWCDVETLCDALAEAMQREKRLRVVMTGGAIPGHDEASSGALLSRLAALEPSRVRVLGWVESERLAGIYAACDVALHIELPLYERTLGAENRVIEWLAHGLTCITTALSETGRGLACDGLVLEVPAGDGAALAAMLASAPARQGEISRMGLRGRAWVHEARDPVRAAAPLLEWCDSPVAARDRHGARLVRLGLVSQPQTSIEMLEAYVAALPTAELLRRGARWMLRRIGEALRACAPRVSGRRSAAQSSERFTPRPPREAA